MEASRLCRIMKRQEQVERMLREKDAHRLAEEHSLREARAEEVRKACAGLVRNLESFHKIVRFPFHLCVYVNPLIYID
jgi:hypothetical protein